MNTRTKAILILAAALLIIGSLIFVAIQFGTQTETARQEAAISEDCGQPNILILDFTDGTSQERIDEIISQSGATTYRTYSDTSIRSVKIKDGTELLVTQEFSEYVELASVITNCSAD